MGSLRQIGAGFLLGVISIAAVIGGFALSQAEGGAIAVPSPVVSPSVIVVTATAFPTIPLLTATPLIITAEVATETPAATFTSAPTLTPPPPPTSCLPPAGWVAIQVQAYDDLYTLAQRYRTTTTAIMQGNCLFSNQLVGGSYLYVPPRPTATFIPCGAPYGWVTYYVVAGDTLYNIGVRYRVNVADLQRANCMGNSTFIAVGKPIRVPNVATSTSPFKTPTWTVSPTLELPSPTATLAPPTATASQVPTTAAPTAIPPSATTQPPPTLTVEPSATPIPPTPTTAVPPGG